MFWEKEDYMVAWRYTISPLVLKNMPMLKDNFFPHAHVTGSQGMQWICKCQFMGKMPLQFREDCLIYYHTQEIIIILLTECQECHIIYEVIYMLYNILGKPYYGLPNDCATQIKSIIILCYLHKNKLPTSASFLDSSSIVKLCLRLST